MKTATLILFLALFSAEDDQERFFCHRPLRLVDLQVVSVAEDDARAWLQEGDYCSMFAMPFWVTVKNNLTIAFNGKTFQFVFAQLETDLAVKNRGTKIPERLGFIKIHKPLRLCIQGVTLLMTQDDLGKYCIEESQYREQEDVTRWAIEYYRRVRSLEEGANGSQ